MEFPRINIYLDRLAHNGKIISDRCARQGMAVVAVTKSVLGDTEIASALLEAGISNFGDSRIKNLQNLRRNFGPDQLILLRTPMLSEVEEVVDICSISLNTQIEVVEHINRVCLNKNKSHSIIVMAETDDRREGLMAGQVISFCQKAGRLSNIKLMGLGTNARCISSKKPSYESLLMLVRLKQEIESVIGKEIPVLSGGNSSLYPLLVMDKIPEGINQVRIGEAIMMGHDTAEYQPINGARRDCFILQAETIEVKEGARKAILALGIQDADASNLTMAEEGIEVIGQSSDHTVIESRDRLFRPGDKISFKMNYFGLLSSMTSPFVKKNYIRS